MKPIYSHTAAALGLTFLLAACIPAPRPEPTPVPPPVQTAPPPPAAAPPPGPANWNDAPQSPGDWSYSAQAGGSLAQFGTPGAGAGSFAMRCNAAQGTVVLTRESTASQPLALRIRTQTGDRVVTAQPVPGQVPSVMVAIPARDPILDAMAMTRGRFAIEAQGTPTLYLPAWSEVTRVIQDCR